MSTESNGESLSPDQPASFEDLTATGCLHPCTKTVLSDSFLFLRLIDAFRHDGIIANYVLEDNV